MRNPTATLVAPRISRYAYAGRVPTTAMSSSDLTPDEEAQFQSAYANVVRQRAGMGMPLNPNADDPAHRYDYRAAWKDGKLSVADNGHFTSEYKLADHPNRFVDGVDTITGQPAAGGAAPAAGGPAGANRPQPAADAPPAAPPADSAAPQPVPRRSIVARRPATPAPAGPGADYALPPDRPAGFAARVRQNQDAMGQLPDNQSTAAGMTRKGFFWRDTGRRQYYLGEANRMRQDQQSALDRAERVDTRNAAADQAAADTQARLGMSASQAEQARQDRLSRQDQLDATLKSTELRASEERAARAAEAERGRQQRADLLAAVPKPVQRTPEDVAALSRYRSTFQVGKLTPEEEQTILVNKEMGLSGDDVARQMGHERVGRSELQAAQTKLDKTSLNLARAQEQWDAANTQDNAADKRPEIVAARVARKAALDMAAQSNARAQSAYDEARKRVETPFEWTPKAKPQDESAAPQTPSNGLRAMAAGAKDAGATPGDAQSGPTLMQRLRTAAGNVGKFALGGPVVGAGTAAYTGAREIMHGGNQPQSAAAGSSSPAPAAPTGSAGGTEPVYESSTDPRIQNLPVGATFIFRGPDGKLRRGQRAA